MMSLLMLKAKNQIKALQKDRELECKILMKDQRLLHPNLLGITILAPTGKIPCIFLLPKERGHWQKEDV
jgi:hypothetical protein